MSTYTPISSITLASAASSVTFSGIPQTYTDLVVVASGNVSSGDIRIRYNGDSGSNYSYTRVYGSGSSASSDRASNQADSFITIGGFTNANSIVHLQNYSNTTTFKTALVRTNNPASFVGSYAILWRSTSSITGIELFVTGGGTISSGSTFNLYGIANASITNVAKATGGDTVVTDGTYWYHAFRSSGTFTPTQALTCDVLVVAGAGGGGYGIGGGGGAGGLIAHTSQSLTAQAYTVTIGAGGNGNTGYPSVAGSDGNNSQFGSLTAANGGGGGAGYQGTGRAGGSAGGGGGNATANGGTASAGGQGNNGGAGTTSVTWSAGGGGGSNAVGAAATASNGGNGGAGVSTYSSWGLATGTGQNSGGTVYYAGGGGGATFSTSATPGNGGLGGGGAGGRAADGDPDVASARGVAGTANTGGGGGGGGGSKNGGAGGSGIVIVRYAV